NPTRSDAVAAVPTTVADAVALPGRVYSSPAWVAVRVHWPTSITVTTPPANAHAPAATTVTGNPTSEVPVTANCPFPAINGGNPVTANVCGRWATCTTCEADAANTSDVPSWVAVTVHSPTAVKVSWSPVAVHAPDAANVTGKLS